MKRNTIVKIIGVKRDVEMKNENLIIIILLLFHTMIIIYIIVFIRYI